MFKRTKLSTAAMVAIGGVAMLACAQSIAQETQRVEITGSSIKRVDAESALPVTVLKRDDIERTGATSVEQLVGSLSASNGAGYATSLALGDAARPGFAGASLRALGSNNTLILLNGRRLAVYAFDGGGVSLNDIPLGAVERVEVLRDGASALYGSDAIAGVINLITRKDYKGGELSVNYSKPQNPGGRVKGANATIGFGDLGADKWNILGYLGKSDQDAIRASDRSFSKTAYRPDLGINRLSSNAFPANILTPAGLASPLGNFYTNGNGCLPPTSFGTSATDKRCRFDYASVIDIVNPATRTSAFLKGTVLAGPVELGAEFSYAKNVSSFPISPTPASEATTLNGNQLLLSPTSKYYPTAWLQANFPTLVGQPLDLYWRSVDAGPRTDESTSKQTRALLTADGSMGKWDYGAGLLKAKSVATDAYTAGYLSESKLLNSVGGLLPTDPNYQTGTMNDAINPFGPNDAAGLAAINAAKVLGPVRISSSEVTSADAKISTSDLFALPGGSAGVAFGVELRRETYSDDPLPILNSGDIIGGAGTQLPINASRRVKAFFTELSLPVWKDVELTASLRDDHYSDFGNSINPKLAARWKATSNVLFRASAGKGFRAPTLSDLFQPLQKGNLNGAFNDPFYDAQVGCNNIFSGLYCNAQLNKESGGNPSLKPEKSHQYSFGAVLDVTKNASITIDYFDITQTGLIGIVSADDKLVDFIANFNTTTLTSTSKYAGDVHTKVNAAGQKVIDYVVENYQNLGDQNTRGIDAQVKLKFPGTAIGNLGLNFDATYLITQRVKDPGTGVWGESVLDTYALFGGTFRLKHRTEFLWDSGPWSASLANSWQSSYLDATGTHRVGAYEILDFMGSYKGVKNLTLTAGVMNLMGRNPPSSNQNSYFQVGYDPANTNPAGRTYVVGLKYKFF